VPQAHSGGVGNGGALADRARPSVGAVDACRGPASAASTSCRSGGEDCSNAGSLAGTDAASILGLALPPPRTHGSKELRRLLSTSPDNVAANPRCVWGNLDDAMPRPQRRHFRPPPSCSSVLSAKNIQAHQHSLGGSPASSRAPSQHSARSSSRHGSENGANCAEHHRSGSRDVPSSRGSNHGEALRHHAIPPVALPPRTLDWNGLAAEAEVVGPAVVDNVARSMMRRSQSMEPTYGAPSSFTCNTAMQEANRFAEVTPRRLRGVGSCEPARHDRLAIHPTRASSSEPARRLRNKGVCAPGSTFEARSTFETVFPTRSRYGAFNF
jgi:hypothetical protein